MNTQTRIKTLIALGLLPQDAANIVTTNENVQDTEDSFVSTVLHAATFLRYSNLPDKFKGLWDATSLPASA